MSTLLCIILIGVVLYLAYLYYHKSDKLTLIYVSTQKNKKIVFNAPALSQKKYIPTPYLLSGHIQTLYYAITHLNYAFTDVYPCERAYVKLSDGGQVSIDWVCCHVVDKVFTKKTPIIVILPGLTGDRYCGYMKILIKEACRRGYKCVVLNHRGCSQTPLTSLSRKKIIAKLYCAGSTDDAKAAVMEIRSKFPHNPVYGIGISLGGTLLGNLVAMEKDGCGLKGIVTICAPYELYVCSRHLEKSMFGLYNRGMGSNLVKKIIEHQVALTPLEKLLGINLKESIKEVKGIREFDKAFTAKLQGYGTADNYYRTASLGQRLKDISIPTLLISPTDDPIIPDEVIPYEDAMANENIILATHPCAGHVAFYTGLIPRQWHQLPALDFIQSVNAL